MNKKINGRYEVYGEIGAGGAGKVYVAIDLKKNKKVAIKTSNPDQTMSNFKQRFLKEAKILHKLNHPNIVKFYDYLISDKEDTEMIIMEFVEGISLDKKLKKEKSIDEKEVIKYARQILSALTEVHSHKVYHRDIKPDNVHITVDGNVKLLDFGIIQETFDQDLTRQGSVIGTISYLAPEIIRDPQRKSNEKTDIYALGIMLYQILTGEKPFSPNKDLSGRHANNNLASKIIHDKPLQINKINPSISDEMNHFVMKLIEKEPEDRYSSSKEAAEELENIFNGAIVQNLKGYYENEVSKFSIRKQFILIYGISFLLFGILILSILVIFLL